VGVELIQNHAGTDTDRSFLEVEIADLMVVPCQFNDESVPKGASRQAGAGTPWCDRQIELMGGTQNRGGFGDGPGKRHGAGLHLVDRGVRGVELPGDVVKAHITSGCTEEMSFFQGHPFREIWLTVSRHVPPEEGWGLHDSHDHVRPIRNYH